MEAMPHSRLEGRPRVHLVGVGGIGVSGLAELFAARGHPVTGTDRADSDRLQVLRRRGVDARVGDDPALAAAAGLVIYTSAAPPSHPERAAARAAGIPEYPRGAALAALVGEKDGIGIAGAHGKTTTTAMLAGMLVEAGADPSAAVGGIVAAWGGPVRSGAGRFFVAEADESDGSFLALPLSLALALNIDRDHLENYPSFEALIECFRTYLERARDAAVVALDCPHLARLAEGWRGDPALLVTVGEAAGATLRYAGMRSAGLETRFEAWFRGEPLGEVVVSRPGLMNGRNAAAALAAGLAAGLPVDPLKRALAAFPGVDRRFSARGEADGVTVIDDYGHMPDELAATLSAARSAFPGRRLVAAFQPHLYSRTKAHAEAFATVLAERADAGYVLPVYGAREAPVPGVDAALIARARPGLVALAGDLPACAAALDAALAPGDVLLTLGAGSVTTLGPEVRRRRVRARLARELPGICPDHKFDEPLRKYTTFRAGGPALALAVPRDLGELTALVRLLGEMGLEFKVLGGGTNMLVSDKGYDGVAIRLGDGFRTVELDPDGVGFRAGAAVPMGILFQRLAEAGIAGYECTHHIPGQVGGAIANNSGAYGQDMLSGMVSIRVLGPDGRVEEWDRERMQVRYRATALKGTRNRVILGGHFRGRRGDPAAILAEAHAQAEKRNATQPAGRGSAGCAFKNLPGQEPTGKLVDLAGCKGLRRGDATVSTKHGNYIVNEGAATAAQILELIEEVRRRVRAAHGVELELEVERLGDFG